MKYKKQKKARRWVLPVAMIAAVLMLTGSIGLIGRNLIDSQSRRSNPTGYSVTAIPVSSNDTQGSSSPGIVVDKDLIIPINAISTTVQFYPVSIEGTRMEVLAVQAPDGTIRTAFNTCQVCYASGRGYYKQNGNVLVCQNCGNRFRMSQVEVVSGGCNPVPIFPENKTVDAEKIVISKEFLTRAKGIFARWKNS
ncbi:MAG: DUF2318 domain-containing protein [Treponema sp.]|nr:DUF2318 domain-containing protein [Treponema sp.]